LISEDELTKTFPDSTIDDLAFAVAELAKCYPRTSPVISKRIPEKEESLPLS
jgi:hypothetical protein